MDAHKQEQTTICASTKEEVHKTSKNSEKTDTDWSINAAASEALTESADRSPSPEPNCSICLGKLQNKSFTDGCFHTFCFTCLLEWSKVKAECPLCKQVFKSIIHNVRSIEDYDQYYVNACLLETSSWQSQDGRRFRYPSTLTAERRRHLALERMLEFSTQRIQSALNSRLQLSDVAHPQTSNFRRRVYEEGLWVRPYGNGRTTRIRDSSPQFFLCNPACTHRLVPWLNRELNVLLQNSESQVSFVLELILALITRFDIRGPEFHEHLQPYFQDRTTHFIHEFYNYARSPHNIVVYDQIAEYDRIETCSDNSSTPGSVGVTDDVIVVSGSPGRPSVDDSVIFVPRIERVQHKVERSRRGIHPRHMPLYSGDIYTRKVQSCSVNVDIPPSSVNGIQCKVRVDLDQSPSMPWSNSGIRSGPSSPIDLDSGLPGPSRVSGQTNSKRLSTIVERSGSDSESDCIIIGSLKPKSDRTPEIVDLVSSSECDMDKSTSTDAREERKKDMSLLNKKSHCSRRKHSRQNSRTRSWSSSSSSSSSSTEGHRTPCARNRRKCSPITKRNLHKYYLHEPESSGYINLPSTSRSHSYNHKSPHNRASEWDSASSCSPERRKDKSHKKHSKKTHKLRSVIGSISKDGAKQTSVAHKHQKHKKHKKHHKSRHHSPPF